MLKVRPGVMSCPSKGVPPYLFTAGVNNCEAEVVGAS